VLADELFEPGAVVVGVSAVLVDELFEEGEEGGHLVGSDGGEGVPASLGVGVCDDFLEEGAVLGDDGLLDHRAV
jgi:hypothetical protein